MIEALELGEGAQEYVEGQQWTDEAMLAKAERNNCDVVYSDDHTLLLDFDRLSDRRRFEERLKLLQDVGVLPVVMTSDVKKWSSKGGNCHVSITIAQPLPLERRILVQALLGSDLTREALSLAGMAKGQKNPCVLFRPRVGSDLPRKVSE